MALDSKGDVWCYQGIKYGWSKMNMTRMSEIDYEEMRIEKAMEMNEICGNCGLTFGSHHGGTKPYPINTCPGHEGRMDWENGPGTTFKPTGKYRKVEFGKPAKGVS